MLALSHRAQRIVDLTHSFDLASFRQNLISTPETVNKVYRQHAIYFVQLKVVGRMRPQSAFPTPSKLAAPASRGRRSASTRARSNSRMANLRRDRARRS